MKQSIALLAAMTALTAQVGCSKSTTQATPEAGPEAHGQVATKVSYNAGSYAFLIDSKGSYQIGEGAAQIWSDKLTADEAAQFNLVILPFEGKGTQSLSLEVCTSATTEENQALCQVVTALNAKYAPAELPSEACLSAARKIDDRHRSASHCSVDTDCAFIAPGYSVYEGNTRGSVLIDSGTWFHALPVANAQYVKDNFGPLSDARSEIAASCGVRHAAGNAYTLDTVDFAAPACVANVCQSSSI